MTPLKLADISYTDGLKLLLFRKQALDSGAIPRMTKEAMVNSNLLTRINENFEKKAEGGILSQLRGHFDNLPVEAQRALAGSGIGGGVGALSGLLTRRTDDPKHNLRRALMGGVSGAALGGGLGVLSTALPADTLTKAKETVTDKADKLSPEVTSTIAKIQGRTDIDATEKQKLINALDETSKPSDWSASGIGVGAAKSLGVGTLSLGIPAAFNHLSDKITKTLPEKSKSLQEVAEAYASNIRNKMTSTKTKDLGRSLFRELGNLDPKNPLDPALVDLYMKRLERAGANTNQFVRDTVGRVLIPNQAAKGHKNIDLNAFNFDTSNLKDEALKAYQDKVKAFQNMTESHMKIDTPDWSLKRPRVAPKLGKKSFRMAGTLGTLGNAAYLVNDALTRRNDATDLLDKHNVSTADTPVVIPPKPSTTPPAKLQ